MRFVYDVTDGSPDAEGIVGGHFYLRIIGIGRYEPSRAVAHLETLQGVLAVQLTHSHLAWQGVAIALVNDDDVARTDAGINHGVALHAYEVRGFRTGAKHL